MSALTGAPLYKRKTIDLVERNRYGAWVIYGEIGIKQYYYCTKRKAIEKYKQECTSGPDRIFVSK